MTFLDCPAYLDREGAVRCGLPAEVRYRFIMRSTAGPLESAMIRCPAGHCFSGPIESLTIGARVRCCPARTGARGPACLCTIAFAPWFDDGSLSVTVQAR